MGAPQRLITRRRRTVAGVTLAGALIGPGLALGLPAASGSRASIAIETAADHAYAHVVAERTVDTGGLIVPKSGLTWRILRTSVPSGWSSARLVIVDTLKDGLTTSEQQIYEPTRKGYAPLEVLETGGGVYARRSTSTGCFATIDLNGNSQVGQAPFAVFGHYDAPRYGARTVAVTGTYPYSYDGYTSVAETDTLSRASHLYLAVTQRFIPKKGSKLKPITTYSRFTTLDSAPALPAISYCPIKPKAR